MASPDFWKKAVLHLSRQDPVLKKLIKSYAGEFMVSRGDPFETLLRSIVGQQISVKAAQSIWLRFHNLFLVLNPEAVLAMPVDKIRACGFSARKVEYVKDLAQHFVDKTLSPHEWPTMTDEELIRRLCVVKGIGRWTSEMFLMFYLLRPDVLPVADIGLQNAVLKHYKKRHPLSQMTLEKLGKTWAPYRSVATWYLWRSLDPIPVEY